MKKRPLVIRLLSYLYFAAPLFLIVELMWVYRIGLLRIGSVINYINWHILLLAVLTVAVGYGIWSVRKWGYYLLLVHSALMIFNNVMLYSIKATPVPLWGVILFNVALLSVIITFVRREVNAPYFNPKLRWWEQAARYYYDKMRVVVKKQGTENVIFEARSFDVSETGVFIVANNKVSIGDKFSLELILADKSLLYVDGEVVWVNKPKKTTNPAGFGCRFIAPNGLFKKRMRFHMMDIGAKIKERSVN